MDIARSERPPSRARAPGVLVSTGLVVAALVLAAAMYAALRATTAERTAERPTVVAVGDALRRLAAQQTAAAREAATPAPAPLAVARPAQPPKAHPLFLTARWACAFMAARAQHAGAVVTFRGEYMNDHVGPAWIRPLGCDHGVSVTGLAPPARARIDRADPRPWTFPRRRLVGLFTARLVNGGGVWLDVEDVEQLQDIGRPPRSVR